MHDARLSPPQTTYTPSKYSKGEDRQYVKTMIESKKRQKSQLARTACGRTEPSEVVTFDCPTPVLRLEQPLDQREVGHYPCLCRDYAAKS